MFKWVTLLGLLLLLSCENLTSAGLPIYDVRVYNMTSRSCTIYFYNGYMKATVISKYKSVNLEVTDFPSGKKAYVSIKLYSYPYSVEKEITEDCDLTFTGSVIK